MGNRRSFILAQDRRCLWCGSGEVHQASSPLRLLSVLRCETWRCERCGRRFPLRPSPDLSEVPELPEVVERNRPAGAELYALDDALAKLLKPGLGEALEPRDPKLTNPDSKPSFTLGPYRSPRRSRDA